MLEEIKKKWESKPLFAHFLGIKAFLILYITGFLVYFGWLHLCITLSDTPGVIANQIGLTIYTFLGPAVYILTKRIYEEFEELFKQVPLANRKWKKIAGFPESEEFAFLFSKESDFNRYRQKVHKRVNNKKEKIVSIGLASIFLPLNLVQHYQGDIFNVIFHQSWFSLSVVEYYSFLIYWIIIYALLLSIVWMILTVTHALLMLNREKYRLHITNRIDELALSYEQLEKNGLSKSEIGLLDLSFKRFTAGLSTIVSFVLSLSLKIALVGGFSTIPAIIYFSLNGRIETVWYGACILACSLSILLFILGQYGAWRLWCDAKNNAVKLLNAICAKITMIMLDPQVPEELKKKIEVDAECMNQTIANINKTFAVTYTSSAVFKIVSANFLAFGPLIIEQIVIRFILK